MKKWVSIFLVLLNLAVFSFGCAGISKEGKVKYPQCGAILIIDKDLAEFQKEG